MSSTTAPTLEQAPSVKAGGKSETPQILRLRSGHAWRGRKFFIGGLLILGTIAYATISQFQANAIYYLTLKELNAQRASLIDRPVRVNAPLDKSSIQFDDKTLTLRFNLKDGTLVLPVVYKGTVPDTLDKGESIVAEGRLSVDGVFQASAILVKCPSKYESEPSKK